MSQPGLPSRPSCVFQAFCLRRGNTCDHDAAFPTTTVVLRASSLCHSSFAHISSDRLVCSCVRTHSLVAPQRSLSLHGDQTMFVEISNLRIVNKEFVERSRRGEQKAMDNPLSPLSIFRCNKLKVGYTGNEMRKKSGFKHRHLDPSTSQKYLRECSTGPTAPQTRDDH